MDPEAAIAWGVFALAVVVIVFATAAEVSLASLSRSRLRKLSAQGQPAAQRVDILLDSPGRFLTTLLQLKALALIAAATAITYWAVTHRLTIANLAFWQTLLMIAIVLVQTVTRALAARRSEVVAFVVAPILALFVAVLTPFTWAYLKIARRLRPEDADDRAAEESMFLSEDGLRFLLNASEEEIQIEESEKEMIGSILGLDTTLVREVMVPRVDLVTLEEQTPLTQALDVVIEAGHSRIPVYRDTIDKIVGVLYAKDLLGILREQRTASDAGAQTRVDRSLSSLLRKAYFVPDTKPVDELLREMQKRRVHIAIIVDEYGGTAGAVTIEDLLEEIVGDIQDEYDQETPEIERVSEREFSLSARASLDEVNDALGVNLPSESSDTLGGYIYSELGRVPTPGELVPFEGGVLKVESVAGNSIDRVQALLDPPANAAAEAPVEDPAPAARGAVLSSLFF